MVAYLLWGRCLREPSAKPATSVGFSLIPAQPYELRDTDTWGYVTNMPEDLKPLRKANIKIEDIGKEAVLYGNGQKEIHVLNPVARLIWELCDGNHTIQQMEHEIRQRYAIPEGADIAADVQSTLAIFAAKDILEQGG